MKVKYEKLMILFVVSTMSLAFGVANAKLVAYWKLDEMSGLTISDSIGCNDGTFQGSPSWKAGKIKGAIEFDGEVDYVLIEKESAFDITDEITISAWVKAKSGDKKNVNLSGIVTKGRETAWALQKAGFTNGISFYLKGVGVPWDGLKGKVDVFDGEWHHVVGVYDRSKAYLYIDGVEDVKMSALGAIGTNDFPVCIGYNAEILGRAWCGFIDDIAIFDNALNFNEVSQLYTKGVTSFINPALRKLIDAVQETRTIIKEQQPQKAIDFIEKKLAEYELWKDKNPDDVEQSHRMRSSDLYFLLAKAKKAAGAPKEEVAEAYKSVTELNILSSPNYSSALLWLYGNLNTVEYKNFVHSLLQNNNYCLQVAAAQAELMVREERSKMAIKFLEDNIAAYKDWREEHPYCDVDAEKSLPEMYFQLAKAKESVSGSKEEMADAYSKTFSPSHIGDVQKQTSALIWLLDNEQADRYKKIIRSFKQSDNIKEVVGNVCRYFESKNDWPKYERFLNALFAEPTPSSTWVVFVESCLSDKTNRWAKGYSDYLEGRPGLKFGRDCIIAEKYASDGMFEEASELYKSILKRCESEDDKAIFELKLCESLFNGGKYQSAISELERFIANNKAAYRALVIKSIMLKGQAYIRTGELDQAIETFFTLMMEYPEIKKMSEVNFFVGYCYMLKGEYEAAMETFNYLLKDYPNSLYADKTQIYITRIKSMTE